MKKIKIIVLVFTLSLVSCRKDDFDNQSNCSNTFNLLVEKDWFPPIANADNLSVLRFDSNGNYSENEIYGGAWEIENNCTSIHFCVDDFQGLEFQYEIVSISSNTIKIKTQTGAIITYHTLSYLIGYGIKDKFGIYVAIL